MVSAGIEGDAVPPAALFSTNVLRRIQIYIRVRESMLYNRLESGEYNLYTRTYKYIKRELFNIRRAIT